MGDVMKASTPLPMMSTALGPVNRPGCAKKASVNPMKQAEGGIYGTNKSTG